MSTQAPQDPPYFRIPNGEHGTHLRDGFMKMEVAMYGRLQDWHGSKTARAFCDMIGQAHIVPSKLAASDTVHVAEVRKRDFHDGYRADALLSVVNDISFLTDGAAQQAKLFHAFRVLTADWRYWGIGAFRTIYFISSLTATPWDARHWMKIGGFPPSAYEPISTTEMFEVGMGYVLSRDAESWYAYDAFISNTLQYLHISWLQLEDAILKAFVAALPVSYRNLMTSYDVPDSLKIILWSHDIERFYKAKQFGESAVTATKKLSLLIEKMGYSGEFASCLDHIEQASLLPEWALKYGSPLPQLAEYTKLSPPSRRAMLKTLADELYSSIQKINQRTEFPTDAPDFVCKIYDEVMSGRRPIEFWKLCADIVYHLPILNSRLPHYNEHGELIPPKIIKAEGFRSLLRTRSSVPRKFNSP